MLPAFTAAFLLISVFELGDKTFFIAVILAMRHSRRLVFIGVMTALALMTVLSVAFGQVIALLPQKWVQWAEVILFLTFGFKMLFDARQMPDRPAVEEQVEAAEAVNRAEAKLPQRQTAPAIVTEAFGLTFLAEWGDRTQIATMTLAAVHHPIGVALGAILGHAVCAAIAVVCGRMVCGRISERRITLLGGGLFLLFAAIGIYELM
jgi:putative Ca2+/H+ antiporter (TMEM165/GDT1 family)